MPEEAMNSERDFNQSNIDEFRRNGGKVGGQFEGFPLLLLTSTGARSGAQRVNPVAYFNIDGKIYVVGSSAPSSVSIHPRAKYSTKPAAAIHNSGLISRALPDAARSVTHAMNHAPQVAIGTHETPG